MAADGESPPAVPHPSSGGTSPRPSGHAKPPWSWLTRWGFLRRLDTGTIEEAITRAELRTSGEIRVSVAGFFRGDPRRLADQAFDRLAMATTRHRNAVLLLILPTRRQVVVRADAGIHDRAGEAFWGAIAQTLSRRFAAQEFTAGVVEAIERIGAELAEHFPPDPDGDANELPNAVDVAGRHRR
jgi:uncharacterized membrane protein